MAKTTAKKTVKKAPAKAAAKPIVAAPTVVAVPVCGCGCRGGFGKFLGKLIVVLVIFALGFMACKFLGCHCAHKKMKRGGQFQFVEGCLDMSKIQNPRIAEKIAAADANQDGCITKEELKAWKQEFKANKQKMKNKQF